MTGVVLAGIPGIAAIGLWALRDTERFLLFAVLSAMVVSPLTLFRPGGAQVALADVLLIVAGLACVISIAAGQRVSFAIRGNTLLPALLAFATINALSLGWSVDRSATVKMVVQMIEIVIVIPILFASLPRSIKTIKASLVIFLVASAALALLAFISAVPQLAHGQFNAVNLGFGLGNKNAAGSYIAAGLVIGFMLLMGEERRGRLSRLLAVGVALEALGLLATLSRGSIIGAGASMVIAALMLKRWRRFTACAFLVVVVGYFLVIAPQKQASVQAHSGAYSSDVVRVYSFSHAVQKIKARPVLGSGSGTYYDYIPQLAIGLEDPNNMFLLTWAEIGVFGIAALIFLLVRFARLWLRMRSLPRDAAVLGVTAGAVSLSLLVHFQFDVTWTRGTTSLCFAAMGLMIAAQRLAMAAGAVDEPPPGRRGAALGRQRGPSAGSVWPPPRSRYPLPSQTEPARHAARTGVAEPRSAPSRTSLRATAVHTRTSFAGARVLHVVSSDAYAGLERHALRLCAELRSLDVDARLLCPPTAERMRAEAVAAGVPTLPKAGMDGRWLWTAVRAARAMRPDIVHVHDGRSAGLAAFLAPESMVLVRTQHFSRPASVDRSPISSRLSVASHRRVNRHYAGYIAVSRVAAEAAIQRGEVPAERVVVVPPGVRLADKAAVERAREVRAAAGDTVLLGYAGRFEAEKRVDVLLEALAIARRDTPQLRAVLAGGGTYEGELRALAARLGIEGAVEWAGWLTEPDAMLSRVHFYVNPVPEEGFGMAMAEAMSFELPVVAPASGSSPELVEHGVTGLLVPPRDHSALAEALSRLAGDLDARSRFGAAARERALARYGLRHTAASTAKLYGELLQRRRRG